MTLDDQEKGEAKNGVVPTSAGAAGGEAPASAGRNLFNKLVWHGGSVGDAWLNAASAQVTQSFDFSILFWFIQVEI